MNLTFSLYRCGSMMFDERERLIPVLCSCFEYVLRSADSNVNYQAVPPCLVVVLFSFLFAVCSLPVHSRFCFCF